MGIILATSNPNEFLFILIILFGILILIILSVFIMSLIMLKKKRNKKRIAFVIIALSLLILAGICESIVILIVNYNLTNDVNSNSNGGYTTHISDIYFIFDYGLKPISENKLNDTLLNEIKNNNLTLNMTLDPLYHGREGINCSYDISIKNEKVSLSLTPPPISLNYTRYLSDYNSETEIRFDFFETDISFSFKIMKNSSIYQDCSLLDNDNNISGKYHISKNVSCSYEYNNSIIKTGRYTYDSSHVISDIFYWEFRVDVYYEDDNGDN